MPKDIQYLRWIDEVCQYLEQENIAMNAAQIETLFRPQYEQQLTPQQAIQMCWQDIHERRLTKF